MASGTYLSRAYLAPPQVSAGNRLLNDVKEKAASASEDAVASDPSTSLRSNNTVAQPTPPQVDPQLDEMVRDFCKVGPKPKSEVRARIAAHAGTRNQGGTK